MHTKRHAGFTLLELIVTLAVAAIILSFGVPGFMGFVQNSRATTHTNDLVTALNLARSEATRRGSAVTVCSTTNGASCNGSTDWSTGWVVRDAAGNVLRVWAERSGGANVVTGGVNSLSFGSRGALTGSATTFDIKVPDCTGKHARRVSVNAAGRIAVALLSC
ncbi:MAG TPA: GspH/FimT family pseudopilin [Woeseiaceae bacterium]